MLCWRTLPLLPKIWSDSRAPWKCVYPDNLALIPNPLFIQGVNVFRGHSNIGVDESSANFDIAGVKDLFRDNLLVLTLIFYADVFAFAGAEDLSGLRQPAMHSLHPSMSAVVEQLLLHSRHRSAFSQTSSSKNSRGHNCWFGFQGGRVLMCIF